MSLKSFLNAHREQLLRACEEELGAGWTLEQAGRSFSEALADLRPGNAAAPEPPAQDGALLGSHATTTRARLSIDQLARRSRTPLLLVGEFGTGKRPSMATRSGVPGKPRAYAVSKPSGLRIRRIEAYPYSPKCILP